MVLYICLHRYTAALFGLPWHKLLISFHIYFLFWLMSASLAYSYLLSLLLLTLRLLLNLASWLLVCLCLLPMCVFCLFLRLPTFFTCLGCSSAYSHLLSLFGLPLPLLAYVRPPLPFSAFTSIHICLFILIILHTCPLAKFDHICLPLLISAMFAYAHSLCLFFFFLLTFSLLNDFFYLQISIHVGSLSTPACLLRLNVLIFAYSCLPLLTLTIFCSSLLTHTYIPNFSNPISISTLT